MVSTHLKNISQIGSFPQVGMNMTNIWNHQLDGKSKGSKFPKSGGCLLTNQSWLTDHGSFKSNCQHPPKYIRPSKQGLNQGSWWLIATPNYPHQKWGLFMYIQKLTKTTERPRKSHTLLKIPSQFLAWNSPWNLHEFMLNFFVELLLLLDVFQEVCFFHIFPKNDNKSPNLFL